MSFNVSIGLKIPVDYTATFFFRTSISLIEFLSIHVQSKIIPSHIMHTKCKRQWSLVDCGQVRLNDTDLIAYVASSSYFFFALLACFLFEQFHAKFTLYVCIVWKPDPKFYAVRWLRCIACTSSIRVVKWAVSYQKFETIVISQFSMFCFFFHRRLF